MEDWVQYGQGAVLWVDSVDTREVWGLMKGHYKGERRYQQYLTHIGVLMIEGMIEGSVGEKAEGKSWWENAMALTTREAWPTEAEEEAVVDKVIQMHPEWKRQSGENGVAVEGLDMDVWVEVEEMEGKTVQKCVRPSADWEEVEERKERAEAGPAQKCGRLSADGVRMGVERGQICGRPSAGGVEGREVGKTE